MTVYALMVEEQIEGSWTFMVQSLYSTFEGATLAGEDLQNDIPFYVETMEIKE